MTRVTKFGGRRQKYLPASKFSVKPLIPKKKSNIGGPLATDANAVQVIPRNAQQESSDSTPATNFSGSMELSAEKNEKSKSRHKSKMTPEEKELSIKKKGMDGKFTGNDGKKRPHFKDAAVRSEARRLQRQRDKLRDMICFNCREYGHAVADCPQAKEGDIEGQATGICYRCGSTAHRVQMCRKFPKKDNPYPFAHCFVCNEQGHLSSQCPQNEKGLYPNGGSCKYCGSVRHLARDCKPMKQEEGTIQLGTIDVSQGGDDDDVTIALHKQATTQKSYGQKRNRQAKSEQPQQESQPKRPNAPPPQVSVKPKAKVVSF
ncbi:hypothetical protein HK098_007970 [Nowakowskiella sp. JEL0407]|nr:hypothetical protein HK098_007970 [Nowakowskiella sp. JEL0407]